MTKYIKVKRAAYRDTYTIGKMYVKDDKLSKGYTYLCDTLEDKYRGDRLDGIKVKGKTAIPTGIYKGCFDYSNHFHQIMPHILEVPYFEGIYIHKGNTEKDSLGCIIVGYNDKKGWVSRPTEAMTKLMAAIEGYDELKVIIQ